MRRIERQLCLAGGIVAIAATVLPPLSTASAELFSAHMLQHLLLIVVAAPFLVVSRVFERLERIALIRWLLRPAYAWPAFVGIFLLWHWRAAFQWSAGTEATRLLEHATILLGALLFWSVALARDGRAQLSYGARALFVMTAAVATDLPGVIMVFAPSAICTMPHENALRFGLTPLQDQQVAGLLMWVPANFVFFGIATWLFARWIGDTDSHNPPSSPSDLVIS